jgi:hypothetical protein
MVSAPLITWLLVSTRPDDVSTMPVPAASPPEILVVMSTTAGSTSATIASVVSVVLLVGDTDAIVGNVSADEVVGGLVTVGVAVDPPVRCDSKTPAATAPATSATTATIAALVLRRLGGCAGVGVNQSPGGEIGGSDGGGNGEVEGAWWAGRSLSATAD